MSYDIFSSYYDLLMDEDDYKKRTDYLSDLLKKYGVEKGILLDMGCGTGTISIELAKKGYEVIGIDSSVGMLSKAREKAYEENVDLLLLNQRMEEMDLYGTIDCAVSTLDSLNHIDTKENFTEAIKKTSLFMNPGGILVFDMNTVYKHREVLKDNAFVFETEDVFCAWQNQLNEDNSVDITLDFFVQDEDGLYDRWSEEFTESAYEISEISKILTSSGFEVMDIFDDMTYEPVKENSERAIFIANKVR